MVILIGVYRRFVTCELIEGLTLILHHRYRASTHLPSGNCVEEALPSSSALLRAGKWKKGQTDAVMLLFWN
ncbi:unnamed protein product [Linum tenue]|uniref:Uncharacterized protein n=1 Tax=Linum tenue TaxID=586396 RepID=A0AAV0JGC6_9ROSI|nr:unnamed protein product [Linum tenue]